MRLILLFLTFTFADSFDFVVDSFKKLVDKKTAPCDNFFRHACPLGRSPFDLVDSVFSPLFREIEKNQSRIWDSYQLKSDLNTWFETRNKKTLNDFQLSELYEDLCESGGDTLLFLEQLSPFINSGGCGSECLQYVNNDPDCKRAATHLKSRLELITFDWDVLSHFKEDTENLLRTIKTISAHLDVDVTDGIDQTNSFLDGMKEVVISWIENTPWVINNNLTDSIVSLVAPTVLQREYGKLIRDSVNELTRIEFLYRDCKRGYDNHELATAICLIHISQEVQVDVPTNYFSSDNAQIDFPNIELGFLYYYVTQYSEELASKLGFTGAAIGHELSHMLIKSTPADFLTYFSNYSTNCIQKQFQATCREFKEYSCDIVNTQIDENGADILGLQLAHSLLETYYGDDLNETYVPLNITNHQLFFYATAISFCQGGVGTTIWGDNGSIDEHAPNYIRVNAYISQFPGFREAFQCSDESRMMKSALDQCVIYGEDAPQVKRL